MQWQQDIESGNFGVHVATDPAGPVGGLIATGHSRDDDAAETVGNSPRSNCAPQLWSLGIGGRLHAAGIAGLAARFEQAPLWVFEGISRSRAFYQRQRCKPTEPSSATPPVTPRPSRSATGGG